MMFILAVKKIESFTARNVNTLFHINSIMMNFLYIAFDSHNHHAKRIIHKLFSAAILTEALIIIIIETQ